MKEAAGACVGLTASPAVPGRFAGGMNGKFRVSARSEGGVGTFSRGGAENPEAVAVSLTNFMFPPGERYRPSKSPPPGPVAAMMGVSRCSSHMLGPLYAWTKI